MAADVVVSRELKLLQDQLLGAQREAAAAAQTTMPPRSAERVKESPHERELQDQLGDRDIDRPSGWNALRSGTIIDHLVRDLHVLRKADLVIAKIWLNVLVRRFNLIAFAGLIAVFGLGMANVAGFYALQASVGAVWAASIVALVDLLIAAIVLLLASKSQPGPEIDLAFKVHKMAVETVQADARDLRSTVDTLGQDLKDIRASIMQLGQNPINFTAQNFVIPAALSIQRDLMAFWGDALKASLVGRR